jgi:hypothetical protein
MLSLDRIAQRNPIILSQVEGCIGVRGQSAFHGYAARNGCLHPVDTLLLSKVPAAGGTAPSTWDAAVVRLTLRG